MFKKLSLASALMATYAHTAESAGSCLAKNDADWKALGLTVTTATATNVGALGAIGAAPGWVEDTVGSANAVCDGGVGQITGTLPTIANGVAGEQTGATTTSNGAGTGVVADVTVAGAASLTSITITTNGAGYLSGNTLIFAADSGSSAGNHDGFTYTLVAADFQAFTATGVSKVSGKCSGNADSDTNLAEQNSDGTYQYACGAGYTVKDSTNALTGNNDTERKTACCSANQLCGNATCPSGFSANSTAAATACAGLSCDYSSGTDKATCCNADPATTTTAAPVSEPSPAPVSEPSPAPESLPESSASAGVISLMSVFAVIGAAYEAL